LNVSFVFIDIPGLFLRFCSADPPLLGSAVRAWAWEEPLIAKAKVRATSILDILTRSFVFYNIPGLFLYFSFLPPPATG
jgi:hypothetical protein